MAARNSWSTSYHPKSNNYLMSPGLLRARRIYRTSNIITGTALFGFITAVYFYSMIRVRQEDFSDLMVPTADERMAIKTIEEEKEEKKASMHSSELEKNLLAPQVSERRPDSRFIVGAPSVDLIGRISDRQTVPGTRRQV